MLKGDREGHMSKEELEEFRQRLQRIRIKAEKTTEELRHFEQYVLLKLHRTEKEPPSR
jgi:hypothetical protein